jgi:hypothetical protein
MANVTELHQCTTLNVVPFAVTHTCLLQNCRNIYWANCQRESLFMGEENSSLGSNIKVNKFPTRKWAGTGTEIS